MENYCKSNCEVKNLNQLTISEKRQIIDNKYSKEFAEFVTNCHNKDDFSMIVNKDFHIIVINTEYFDFELEFYYNNLLDNIIIKKFKCTIKKMSMEFSKYKIAEFLKDVDDNRNTGKYKLIYERFNPKKYRFPLSYFISSINYCYTANKTFQFDYIPNLLKDGISIGVYTDQLNVETEFMLNGAIANAITSTSNILIAHAYLHLNQDYIKSLNKLDDTIEHAVCNMNKHYNDLQTIDDDTKYYTPFLELCTSYTLYLFEDGIYKPSI